MPISKADLENFYSLSKLTEDLYELIQRMKAKAESTTAAYSSAPSGGGMPGDKVGDGVAKYTALRQQFEDKLNEYAAAAADVNEAVMLIDDPDLRDLMVNRYLRGMKWEDVAVEIHRAESYCYKLHDRALKAMGLKEDSQ